VGVVAVVGCGWWWVGQPEAVHEDAVEDLERARLLEQAIHLDLDALKVARPDYAATPPHHAR